MGNRQLQTSVTDLLNLATLSVGIHIATEKLKGWLISENVTPDDFCSSVVETYEFPFDDFQERSLLFRAMRTVLQTDDLYENTVVLDGEGCVNIKVSRADLSQIRGLCEIYLSAWTQVKSEAFSEFLGSSTTSASVKDISLFSKAYPLQFRQCLNDLVGSLSNSSPSDQLLHAKPTEF